MTLSKYLILIFLFTTNMLLANEMPSIESFASRLSYKTMTISPDGKHIAFTYEEEKNEVRLAIITTDMKKITATFGFGENKHIFPLFWANNNRFVMSVVNSAGYLDKMPFFLHTIAANVDGSNIKRLYNPKTTPLRIISNNLHNSKYILVENYLQPKLQQMNVANGTLELYAEIPAVPVNTQRIGIALDLDKNLRLVFDKKILISKNKKQRFSIIFRYKKDSKWRNIELPSNRINPSFSAKGFNLTNDKFYFISNMDMEKHDKQSIFSFDLNTEAFKREFHHKEVDIRNVISGPKGEVLGVQYYPGYPSQFYFDVNNNEVKLLSNLSKSFPSQIVEVSNYSVDGLQAIVKVYSDKNPGDFFLYQRDSSKLSYLASSNSNIHPKNMSTMEAFSLSARDGIKLYGSLTLPINKPNKKLPLIVMPHNTHFRTTKEWSFDAPAQFFASRGFAVLQVNVRGSTGFGEDFQIAGYNEWGRKIQDDITDATLWAIKEGVADKNRICLYGESYGGYAAIQGLIREPELYKCGVSVSGFYDVSKMIKKRNFSSSGYFYSNIWLKNYFGENQDLYKNISPAYNVNKIKGEIFVIHGTEDKLIPIQQAEILMEQLDEAGKDYKSLILKEDHGFSQLNNRQQQYQQVLAFFKKYIGVE